MDGYEKKFLEKNTSLHPGLPAYEKRSAELSRTRENLSMNIGRDSRNCIPIVPNIKLVNNFSSSTFMKACFTEIRVSLTMQVKVFY